MPALAITVQAACSRASAAILAVSGIGCPFARFLGPEPSGSGGGRGRGGPGPSRRGATGYTPRYASRTRGSAASSAAVPAMVTRPVSMT